MAKVGWNGLAAAGFAGAAEAFLATEAATFGSGAAGSGVRPGRRGRLGLATNLRGRRRDDFAVSEAFHRLRHGVELGDDLAIEGDVECAFNLAHFVTFLASAEGVSDAAGAGASGAADTVDEVFGDHRKVEVDDMGDAVDVDAAGGDVGGDEDAVVTLLEACQSAVSLTLGAIAVDAGGFDTDASETLGELFDAMAGPGEDKEGTGFAAEHVMEEVHFPVVLDLVEMEVDVFGGLRGGSEGDADGVGEMLGDELGGAGLDGGGEEERLALFRDLAEDLVESGEEAHVEHAVAFVEDDVGDLAQVGQAAIEEVTEAAGGGDDDLDTAAKRVELGTFSHTADDGGGAEAGAEGDFFKFFRDLDGEFAGGAQDESARTDGFTGGGRLLQHRFDERQAEGKGFACAGLRGGYDIVAGESGRDGFRLDGRRYRVALLIQVAQENRGQRQVSKEVHFVFERRSQINDPTVVLAKYKQGKEYRNGVDF